MKTTIMQMIVVAALSFSGAALAATEAEGKMQTPAAEPATPAAKPAPAAPKPQPAVKPSASAKPARAKPPRPKNLDLRHCLELETDAAIAKCAGE